MGWLCWQVVTGAIDHGGRRIDGLWPGRIRSTVVTYGDVAEPLMKWADQFPIRGGSGLSERGR